MIKSSTNTAKTHISASVKKADGESRKDYHERQTMARKKMSAAYKDLNNNFDRDIANAKTKRKKAAILAGGRY